MQKEQTGILPIRLDDAGHIGALLMRKAGYESDVASRVKRFHDTHHDTEDPLGILSPFILPGLARVTTEPFGEGYGALVHCQPNQAGTALLEQWIVETVNASAPVTITLGGYAFTGTPMRYPRRLPRQGTSLPSAVTQLLPLAGGRNISSAEFFAGAIGRGTAAMYAVAEMKVTNTLPSYNDGGEGWEEVLWNASGVNPSQKMWVYAEKSSIGESWVETKVHVAWRAHPTAFNAVPFDACSCDTASTGQDLADWVAYVSSALGPQDADFRYATGTIRLYPAAPQLFPFRF